MELEVGKKYKCRNDKAAEVTHKNMMNDIYEYGGNIWNEDGTKDRLAYWMSNGRYLVHQESGSDILEEIKTTNL